MDSNNKPKTKQILARLANRCEQNSHSYEIKKYKTLRESIVVFYCYKHNCNETHTVGQYLDSRHGLFCCARDKIQRVDRYKERKQGIEKKALQLAEIRNHTLKDFVFKNRRDCTFTVVCRTHKFVA